MKKRGRHTAFLLVTTTFLVGACTADDEFASPSTTRATPALTDLLDAIDETVGRRTASFQFDVTQTLPLEEETDATYRRFGTFDDLTWTGAGGFSIESDNAELTEELGGLTVEFRVVDQVIWTKTDGSSPQTWTGMDRDDFFTVSGSDAHMSVDGDIFLLAFAEAAIRVNDHLEDGLGSEVWHVEVTVDDLLSILLLGGPGERIAEAGFEGTDMTAPISFVTDTDGMVVAVRGTLDSWWQEVVAQTNMFEATSAGMTFELKLSDFDLEQPAVESPCVDSFEEMLELNGTIVAVKTCTV